MYWKSFLISSTSDSIFKSFRLRLRLFISLYKRLPFISINWRLLNLSNKDSKILVMSNDFLRQYKIPTLTNIEFESESKKKGQEGSHLRVTGSSIGISNYRQYLPPEIQEHKNYLVKVQKLSPLKRLHKNELSVENSDVKIKACTGRDPSYPDDLNSLINPFNCELCKVKLNSHITASYHYVSKTHDRKITAWLAEHYPDRPPPVKRFFKETPTSPEALRCDLCDLPLTSLAHATQHYAGRRHNLVANKKSDPSGAGYYNSEGKWIRTATKKFSIKNCDNRFGIGEDFIQSDTPVAQEPNEQKIQTIVQGPKPDALINESLCCKVCSIVVTSPTQMAMHVTGSKHKKKLALSDVVTNEALQDSVKIEETNDGNTNLVPSTIKNDNTLRHLSMYRTPTGSYYCRYCNSTMNHVTILQQHIQGKKHKMKVKVSNQLNEQKDLDST